MLQRIHPVTAAAMTALLLIRGPAAYAEQNVELRVSRIALFSSGVGFFERDSTVTDDATAELKFRTEQINDILKSLVVQDFGGGSVGVVSYASRDPIEKTLRSFAVDITGKPTLAQLLDQLRGEPVEITGARTVNGVIVGVERQRITLGGGGSGNSPGIVDIDVLNVLTEGGIQQLRLSDLQGIKLTNEKVDAELRKALSTLASSHDADKKAVVLEFLGKGQRRVRASYLLEAPIWKTSYRLVLNGEKAGDAAGKSADRKPFLQGWATVENATEEDWKDVRLSLVSGRPISFRMDLYTPIYIPRPIEQLELYASLRPPEFAAGYEQRRKDDESGGAEKAKYRLGEAMDNKAPGSPAPAMKATAGRRGAGGKEMVGLELAEGAMISPADADIAMTGQGVASVATAQEAGELFEYSISQPVSIARQHSAMLPIVNEEVAAEKVSIFNPATHPKHPLNGLILTNSTKLNLMQGPVTIFDSNVYAGDAKLPDLKPGEKRMVGYALDLGTEVMIDQKSQPEQLVSLRIAKGTLWQKRKYADEREYSIKNKEDKERTVVLEQAFSPDWTLVEPKEPFERTPNLLRFKVVVPGMKTVTQKVRLEWTAEQAVALTNLDFDTIMIFVRSGKASPKVQEALQKVIALRTELDQVARQRADAERDANEAVAEQNRVRENLKTLDKGGDSHKRQSTKFDQLETQIEQARERIAGLRKQEEQKRAALESYLLSLEVE